MKEKFKHNCLNNIFVFFILILLFRNVYNFKNEIQLFINKNISDEIINSKYYRYISEVVVNGLSGHIYNYTVLLNEAVVDIIIKFNAYLNDCSEMFFSLRNILYVNTSNFYSSNVNSTKAMFSSCYSLTSIYL